MQSENSRQSMTSMDTSTHQKEQRIGPDINELNCVHFLGKGTYGLSTLWIANHKTSSKLVMVRKTNLDLLEYDDLENLQYEMQLSSQLQHPAILSFHCSFVHNREIWTVFPFFDYGSCADIVEAGFPNGIHEAAIMYILRNVLHALEYLHKAGYIHRAVKATHILVSSDGRVSLTGLRYCSHLWNNGVRKKCIHNFPEHAVAVLPWIAPEVLEQNLLGYNEKSDIYSIGITAIELATGKVPFTDMPATQIFLDKLNGQLPEPLGFDVIRNKSPSVCSSDLDAAERNSQLAQQSSPKRNPPSQSHLSPAPQPSRSRSSSSNQLPSQPRQFSAQFQQLIELCLERLPYHRPSATSLLGMSSFKQVKKKSKEFLNISDLLHPVCPIATISTVEAEASAEHRQGNVSWDMEKMELTDDWIL